MTKEIIRPSATLRFFFVKKGRAKYISALDLIKCFQRALRRTDLPVWQTQGFNPHTYVNVNLPLALGTESCCESMDIKFTELVDYEQAKDKFNAVLPDDLKITKVALPVKSHTEIIKSEYHIKFECDYRKFKEFLSSETIITEKKTKKGIAEIDIKPYLEINDLSDGEFTLLLPSGCDFTLNPSLLFDAYEAFSGEETENLHIMRTRVICKDGTDFV